METDFTLLDTTLRQQHGHIIHQVWFGTIPNKRAAQKAYQKMKLYRDSWISLNPTWYRMEWNKPLCVQLIKTYYPEHLEMFNQYKYEIQRCDAIRYIILHRYGGWYADMDYYCSRPLDDARKNFPHDIYFVQSPNKFMSEDDHVSNSLMYSCPGHSFWRLLLIELEKNRHYPYYYTKHLAVMFTTGPGLLNRVYTKYKQRFKLKSLPWKLFHPYGIGDAKMVLKKLDDVYAVHIGTGSWENQDTKFLLFLLCNWPIVAFIIVVFVLAVLLTKLV